MPAPSLAFATHACTQSAGGLCRDLAKLSGRPVPEVPSAVALPMQLPAAAKRDITREAGVPGLLLAAGGMAIGRIWKTIKSAFPPVRLPWLREWKPSGWMPLL